MEKAVPSDVSGPTRGEPTSSPADPRCSHPEEEPDSRKGQEGVLGTADPDGRDDVHTRGDQETDGQNPSLCNLGGNDGMGFGWDDQTVYKLGINYDYNKTWSFRGGVNYGKSPIQNHEVLFNMLAPATVEWHATIGASYRPSPNIEW